MTKYADPDVVKSRAAVRKDDLALVDLDGDADTDGDDFDQLIAELNERASATIDEYCQRTFSKTTETITLDGNGRDRLRLPGYPVQSVSTLKISDETKSSDEYRVRQHTPGRDGSVENGGILELKSGVFPDLWEAVEVSYTWGYSTAPGGVRDVAEQLVVDALRSAAGNNKGGKGGATSYSMDGFSVTFDTDLKATVGTLSAEQKEQLDRHRRVVVA